MTLQLWTAADLGKALDGRRGSLVQLWYSRGKLPEPKARTQDGTRLWTDEQAQAILTERRAYLDQVERQAEEQQRANRVIAAMLAR